MDKNNMRVRFKVLFLVSAMLVYILALALPANAAVTDSIDCNASFPSVLSLDTELNATFNASTTDGDWFVAFELKSASTANSTFSLIANVSNATNNFHANVSLLVEFILEDSNDYIGRATCYSNVSGTTDFNSGQSDEQTGITIDRTAPSTPTAISPGGRNITDRDHTFSATVTGIDTTQCTLTFTDINPGSTSYAMTHTGNTCSQAITGIAEGSYPFTITASDGTNISVTTVQTFSIDLPSASSRKAKLFSFLGGGDDRASVERGLAIAQATRAGDVSAGLVNANLKVRQFVQKETQPQELVKTGIGALIGGIIGASGFLGGPLGFVTVPIGVAIGGGIGVVV